jgi:hypothetical protein
LDTLIYYDFFTPCSRLSSTVEERLRKHLTITEVAIEEPGVEEDEEVVSLPEITPEMESVIKSAMSSGGKVS